MVFDRENPIPLALGIHRSIRGAIESGQIECSSPSITYVALRSWTRRNPYLRALVKGGERFNLRGEPEGEVTQDEIEQAIFKLPGNSVQPEIGSASCRERVCQYV